MRRSAPRTGRRGVSVRATGAWDLADLHALWQRGRSDDDGLEVVRAELARVGAPAGDEPTQRRVLVHTSGFQVSPYADVTPAGDAAKDVARKLWHRSPGSPG